LLLDKNEKLKLKHRFFSSGGKDKKLKLIINNTLVKIGRDNEGGKGYPNLTCASQCGPRQVKVREVSILKNFMLIRNTLSLPCKV